MLTAMGSTFRVHGRRRLVLLRRAETQVREYPIGGDLVVEVGHDLELAPALAARQGIGLEDLGDQARPARGTAAERVHRFEVPSESRIVFEPLVAAEGTRGFSSQLLRDGVF